MRKACVDCTHYRPGGSERDPWCMRFAKEFEVSWSPVSGPRTNLSAPDCKVARDEGGQCGPKGRSWEPRRGTTAYDEWAREQVAEAVGAVTIIEPPPSWWDRIFGVFRTTPK